MKRLSIQMANYGILNALCELENFYGWYSCRCDSGSFSNLVVLSASGPSKTVSSTNSRVESIANEIFMFYLRHAVINVVISLLDVSSKPWQLIGIQAVFDVRCALVNWRTVVSYVIRIELCAMNVMLKSKLLVLASTCVTSASKLYCCTATFGGKIVFK